VKKRFNVILLFLFSAALSAQTEHQSEMLVHFEDSLVELRNVMLNAPNNQTRTKANEAFTKAFRVILSQGISYNYNFDSVPSIGDLRSPDNAFRMITWNLPFNDGTHEYYSFVQVNNSKKKKVNDITLIQLYDKSSSITKAEKKVLSDKKWFGALYYKIIPIKNGNKTYYTLLGWDGNDQFTSKKLIDVMYFSGKQIKFGAPIFKQDRGQPKRVIFELSTEAIMSVRYFEKEKQIVFDHLSPMRDDLKGIRQYYVPDMSFDAYELRKGKWVYLSDLDARNKENILTPYTTPE
jgi:hypothetical protein